MTARAASKAKPKGAAKAGSAASPKKASPGKSAKSGGFTTGIKGPAKKAAPKKAAAAKMASAHAIPRPSPLHATIGQIDKNSIVGATKTIVKKAKAVFQSTVGARPVEPQLPKKLTPFAGWPTNPSEDDIAKVIKARKHFSVDNS